MRGKRSTNNSMTFKKCIQTKVAKFEPWNPYEAMVPEKQIALINSQINLHIKFRSLLVSGFANDETTTMNREVHMETDNKDLIETPTNVSNLRHLNVCQYILNKYKDIDGEKLFNYGYPVSLGIRELIVNQKHYFEAKDLCSVMKYDLVKVMSYEAGSTIFDDYIEIKEASDQYLPWEPYSIC